jgi:hypothetical protein
MGLRRKWLLAAPVCLVLLLRVPFSQAAVRTWTDVTGRHSTEADFVDFKDGKVRLRKTGGTVISVRLERLSSVDQRYVKARGRWRAVAKIGLAMHSYEMAEGTLPKPASCARDGRPLLSWRVRLLPYLKEKATYDKFRLDEPWDSTHNVRLLKEMPEVFRLSREEHDGKTSVMLFVGEGTPFGGGNTGPRFRDIADGLSHTMMAVEAGADKAVPWTKPEDLIYDEENPVAALGAIPAEGFWAVFFSGEVRLFPKDIASGFLRALITHDGGEPVDELARLNEEEAITTLIARQRARVAVEETISGKPVLAVDLSDSRDELEPSFYTLRRLTRPFALKLAGSAVTDDTLKVLSVTSGPRFVRLSGLDLSDSHVTDAGLDHLKELTRLQLLDLRGTKVTEKGVKKLQQSLPNCKIIR